jgi:hypothetical protein
MRSREYASAASYAACATPTAGRDVDPADLQRAEHLFQAAALLAAEQVLLRYPHADEGQLTGLRPLVPQFGEIPSDGETGRRRVDEQHRQLSVLGLDQDREHAGDPRVGDPGLRA